MMEGYYDGTTKGCTKGSADATTFQEGKTIPGSYAEASADMAGVRTTAGDISVMKTKEGTTEEAGRKLAHATSAEESAEVVSIGREEETRPEELKTGSASVGGLSPVKASRGE